MLWELKDSRDRRKNSLNFPSTPKAIIRCCRANKDNIIYLLDFFCLDFSFSYLVCMFIFIPDDCLRDIDPVIRPISLFKIG